MNATTPRLLLLPTLVRWLARGTGLALVLLVLALTIGHWPLPNPFRQPLPVALESLFIAATTLGLVAAWRWELVGALVSLAALVGFYIVEWSVNGEVAGGFFPLFAVPLVLYLLDVGLRRPGALAPRESASRPVAALSEDVVARPVCSDTVRRRLRIGGMGCALVLGAIVASTAVAADDVSPPAETALKESRRRFQDQELTVASPFAYLLNPNQPPPRIIWRDVDEVRRLGSDGVLHVRWFDADLNESAVPNRPGRWGAYVSGVAPNGTPVRRAMTFYCRPPNFLLYFPTSTVVVPPYQPGPIVPGVWAQHGEELAAAHAQSWFRSLNGTESGAILIAGLSESRPLGRQARATETAAARNESYHLKLKLKVLGLGANVRPLAPPRTLGAGSAPALRAGSACAAGMSDDAKAAIDAVCEAWARDTGEPFVALVARRGVIVTHRAFGNDADGSAVSLDYRCGVFSITKTVTSIAFSQFVDQGLVDLDDSIATVFPDFPEDPARVPTFRQCLTHMSGLAGHGDWGGSTNPHFENVVLNGIDANEAGKAYAYSGAGFDLAAKAMEIVTGKTWRQIYQDHLFEPLGLGDIPMDNASAGARLTARELATFGQWLANRGGYADRQFVSPHTFARLLPKHLGRRYPGVVLEEGIGMHWMNVARPGRAPGAAQQGQVLLGPRTVGHGSLSGCTLLVDLDRDLVIVQVRRQAGPRHAEWLPRFAATVVDALRE